MASSAASGLKYLSNALATPEQLSNSSSSIDGVPVDLEASVRYAGAQLTQTAGILLRLSQDIIAQAIVTFTRFWIGSEGGSLRIYSVKDVSAAALYMTAKLSFQPTSPRSVLNVYAFLLSKDASPLWFINSKGSPDKAMPETYHLTEGDYHAQRLVLLRIESIILQTLGVPSSAVAHRVFEHLNSALASREVGVKLVDGDWWEVFDVDREDLGFLVVGMRSMEGFARAEMEKWKGRGVPMTVDELEGEIEHRRMMEEGE